MELRNQAALRGREKGGHVELCFGHRRLAAVTSLGWKEVEVDIVKLTDQEMALDAQIENMQREGLNDADRGDGIVNYIKLKTGIDNVAAMTGAGGKNNAESKLAYAKLLAARDEIANLLGLSVNRVTELLKIAGWHEGMKEPIREQKIAGRTAVVTARMAGKEDAGQAVQAVAKKEIGYRAIEKIASEFAALPEETDQDKIVKEKVRKSFVKGEIEKGEEVVTKARQFKAATTRKETMPPDLIDLMRGWTERAQRWHVHLGDREP
jgi:ParB-like chromosome segregation protein Spo0J